MPNQLANESSPYLLQHRDNPVNWFPWGEAALERSRVEDRPIFLSIGYSACHWCHVMEHESFENERIATILNEHFVCIKVDREERPDLDQIYMNAVQMMTGRGGWPMSVFLTPQLQPFYGGTYWPPTARMGMPGFDDVLRSVCDAWTNRRDRIREQSATLTSHLQNVVRPQSEEGQLTDAMLHDAGAAIERVFDFTHGGFGGAPKFPRTMDLSLIFRIWRRWPRDGLLDMARLTLDRMAAGGIYDQLGGGFARYSVDAQWLVPHFEKMLYDNALLVGCYLDGYQATGEPRYARVVRETLDYILRDMTGEQGGFYSTEDADSEGVEGKFYVWTVDEIAGLLGPERGKTFAYVYDVSAEGNFEDANILNLPKTVAQCARLLGRDEDELADELAASRTALLAARDRRVRPGRDDKVLAGWNGLMIDAMARAGAVLGEPRYVQAASRAMTFVLENMRRGDARLLHTWRHGRAKLDAYLDDYACLIGALVTLYEADFDERQIEQAAALADVLIEQFADPAGGGFFFTAADHEKLIARNKDMVDSATPSGNATAALALLRLGTLTGIGKYTEAALSTLRAASGLMKDSPAACGAMFAALDFHLGPTPQIVLLTGQHEQDTADVLADLNRRYLPNKALACRCSAGDAPGPLDTLFAGKDPSEGGPVAMVCKDFACDTPAIGKQAILAAWEKL